MEEPGRQHRWVANSQSLLTTNTSLFSLTLFPLPILELQVLTAGLVALKLLHWLSLSKHRRSLSEAILQAGPSGQAGERNDHWMQWPSEAELRPVRSRHGTVAPWAWQYG